MAEPSGVTRQALLRLMTDAGLALLECQRFEEGVKLLLCHLEHVGAIRVGTGDGDDLLGRLQKHTAGQLVALFREHTTVEDPENLIGAALTARNEIIHRFFISHIPSALTPAGLAAASGDLERLRSTIESAQELIDPHLLGLMHHMHGLDYKWISHVINEAIGEEETHA